MGFVRSQVQLIVSGHYVRERTFQSFVHSQFKQTSRKQNHLDTCFYYFTQSTLFDIHPLLLYRPLPLGFLA